jgi:hypothetical protein
MLDGKLQAMKEKEIQTITNQCMHVSSLFLFIVCVSNAGDFAMLRGKEVVKTSNYRRTFPEQTQITVNKIMRLYSLVQPEDVHSSS